MKHLKAKQAKFDSATIKLIEKQVKVKQKYPVPKGNLGKLFNQKFFETLEGNR